MKPIIKLTTIILVTGAIFFVACKKDNYVIATLPLPPSPAKATINFHIKNSLVVPADSIYLYRIISTPTSNIYDSSQNIYLRPNIDTTFICTVGGNTLNVLVVGIPDFDAIPYFIESRYIVAGSNVNWDIFY